MALMKGIYVDTEGKEHIVDLKLNADGKLEISGLQVDTLEMGSLQIASGSDASELQITNGAAMVNPGALSPATDAVSLSAETMTSGRLLTVTAGTKVQITTTSTPIVKLVVQALKTNTGDVVFGGSGVIAAVATRAGNTLEPGDSADVYVNDLTAFYLDSVVNGEGVIYNYYTTAVPTGD